jgi:hypothetical protein
MQSTEQLLILPIVTGVTIQVTVSLALRAWGKWVASRQGQGIWWRRAAWAPVVALLLAIVGVGLTCAQLVHAFSLANLTSADQRSFVLAEGIARAMRTTGWTVPLSWLLYVASLVIFAIGSLRRRVASSKTTPTATPS